MRLRIYEFHDVNHNRVIKDSIHAGQQPLLRIPFSWFNAEDKTRLAHDFPAYTVVRKRRVLTDDQKARKKLDLVAQAVEQNKSSEEVYQKKRQDLLSAQATDETKDAPHHKPHSGAEGCCGRGCNGCLHFWHDKKYEKSRALLRSKEPGELLTREEAKRMTEKEI
jgi:putative protease